MQTPAEDCCTLLQKQRAIKNPAESGGGAAGLAGRSRRIPARSARLIGRANAAPWRRGKARSSLRGLERVHARGQRCRAGRRSTAAPPPRPRRASPEPPPPPKAAAPPVRARAGGAAAAVPRRAAPCPPPGLAIRRRAAPPAGLEEALCSSPGSRCRRRHRRAPGSSRAGVISGRG
nr:serine/arginine repetitive matrix protein 1-like isoform X2 [Taeniopygia guttata]